jgi:lactoylglutathione lyase
MRIEHLALWTADLERLRAFYERYFGAQAGARYENPAKQFSSYFMRFGGGGARVEIMHRPALRDAPEQPARGYAHLAMSVGSEAAVDALATQLRADGYPVIDGPRRTGDGYYEAVVLDPDGNRIEITV